MVVSSGLVGDSITVPDVSGMTEDEAQSALENAGFRNSSSECTYHDSVPSGQVIGTTPEANAEATEDTEIVMQVSSGIRISSMRADDACEAKLLMAFRTSSPKDAKYMSPL